MTDLLHKQIEAEEREIAILKAKLAIKERATYNAEVESTKIELENSVDAFRGNDLLDILDALGSRSGEAASKSLSKDWLSQNSSRNQNGSVHKKDILRLQPLLSGIQFTSITSVRSHLNKDANKQMRAYELCGSVCLPQIMSSVNIFQNNVVMPEPITFKVVADISIIYMVNFKDGSKKRKFPTSSQNNVQGQIERLDISYSNRCTTSPELKKLSEMAKDNNLPRLFQHLVVFAEFDRKRFIALNKLISRYGNEQIHLIDYSVLKLFHPTFVIVLEWKWRFSAYDPGNENLEIVQIQRLSKTKDDIIENIIQQIECCGIEELIESVGGCEQTIIALLDIISSEPKKKERQHTMPPKAAVAVKNRASNEQNLGYSVLDIIKKNHLYDTT